MNKASNLIKDAIGGAEIAIPRQSLGQEAADLLREMILLEKLAPGMPVPERDLSEAFGISRTPLKEALRTLENEGLVEYSATRRPKVADPTLEDLRKNIRVLAALEALGGEMACETASDEEIENIVEMEKNLGKSADPELDFFKKDMEFHSAIVAASHNEPLVETHRQYNARLWRARFLSSRQPDRRKNTNSEHRNIANALSAKDTQMTSNALKSHLDSTIVNITRVWRSNSNQNEGGN